MIRLLKAPEMGAGIHRAGWPFVLSLLRQLESARGILLDDYVDRTYFHPPAQLESFVPTEPWIGIFHYPPRVPEWYAREMRIPALATIPRWNQAKPLLRRAIALAPNIASWVESEFNVPCASVKHPGVEPELKWTPEKFLDNPRKALIQAGSFLRNTSAIYQLRTCPVWLRRVHLRPTNQWAPGIDELCRRFLGPDRAFHADVEVWDRLSDVDYDRAFSENMIFTETLGGGANNLVIECIARHVPIVINRSEPAEYYLGPDYPLFYEDFEGAPALLSRDSILRAHEYLAQLDKAWMTGPAFVRQVAKAIDLENFEMD